MARGGASATVVVIGGGCSGTLAAVHLLRGWHDGELRVVIVEPEHVGPGVAYGTPFAGHLLNSPAMAMSAYPDRPAHFAEWAQKRCTAAGEGSVFLPRNLYGKYLESVLAEAAKTSPRTRSLIRLKGKVAKVNCHPGARRAVVGLENGRRIEADRVVLALGSLPPANPRVANPEFYRSARYVADPWVPGALDALNGPVLLVGTGLTALDVALALDEQGHQGPIQAVSRRGLIPQPHRPAGTAPRHDALSFDHFFAAHRMTSLSVRDVLSWLREAIETTGDWRVAVDHLRPYTPAIWSAMPDLERARFVRHALRFWEVHRHRMAPEVACRIETLTEKGRLRIHTGSVERYEEDGRGVRAILRGPLASAGLRPELPRVAHVVNCTGPLTDVTAAGDGLLDSLLVSGHVRPGPMGLGIDVTSECTVVDARGDVHGVLWAIGPLCKGAFWETTAVPEIRAQAVSLASQLSSSQHSNRRSGRARSEDDRHPLDARDEVGATERKLVVSS